MILAIRKIRDFITANGTSSEASIIADCAASGLKQDRVEKRLNEMTARGKLVKVGNNYSFPA